MSCRAIPTRQQNRSFVPSCLGTKELVSVESAFLNVSFIDINAEPQMLKIPTLEARDNVLDSAKKSTYKLAHALAKNLTQQFTLEHIEVIQLEAARQIEQITITTLTFKKILQPYQISVILSSVCADFPDVKTPKKRARLGVSNVGTRPW